MRLPNISGASIDNLDINKAQGPDAISGAVLKNCSKTLAYPLSILFTLTYNTGCIPQEWKLANVVPVFKKGDKNKVTNYRPISLTSLVMKVLERILYDELFTRTIDKIDKRQHGFLKNKSCNTILLTKTTAARNEDAFSYLRVRGLCFMAVFVATITYFYLLNLSLDHSMKK